MSNPRGVTTTNAPDLAGAPNGILASVPGEFVSLGSGRLPSAEAMEGQRRSSEVDAGWLGLVRITYEAKRLRYRKSSRWVWVAVRADKMPT